MKRLWRAAVQSLPIKKPFLLKKRLHIVDVDASECLMRSVAEWCSLRMLATAQVYRSIFFSGEHVRPKLSCFVRSVAERLVLAQSTGTPCVRFSLLKFDSKRGFLCDNRFFHFFLLRVVSLQIGDQRLDRKAIQLLWRNWDTEKIVPITMILYFVIFTEGILRSGGTFRRSF
jgi:hypothetical protein